MKQRELTAASSPSNSFEYFFMTEVLVEVELPSPRLLTLLPPSVIKTVTASASVCITPSHPLHIISLSGAAQVRPVAVNWGLLWSYMDLE